MEQSKMNGMVIYVARNRDLLLGVKLVNHFEFRMQRPLSKVPNKNGDYTMVVYQKNHAINMASLQSVRLTSSTYGKMVHRDHNEDCSVFAQLLADSVPASEPKMLEELGLSKATINRLHISDVKNVSELLAVRSSLLKKFPGVGKATLEEIEKALEKYQLKLNPFN